MRDTRMVERKKTGRAKARKGVSSFWSHNTVQANVAVHLGQALIGFEQSRFSLNMHTLLPTNFRNPHILLLIASTANSIVGLDYMLLLPLLPGKMEVARGPSALIALPPPFLPVSTSLRLCPSLFASFVSNYHHKRPVQP